MKLKLATFTFILISALSLMVYGSRLGGLSRESEVFTPNDLLYPVFEIQVPPGYQDVQIRASVNNFATAGVFIYDTCTTGHAANPNTGTNTNDPDPWVYLSNPLATTSTPGSEFKRYKLDMMSSTSHPMSWVTYSYGATHTPGRTILFQPSRGNVNASVWMRQSNPSLIWIYQLVDAGGVTEKNANGSEVWHTMYPREWRATRITLTP